MSKHIIVLFSLLILACNAYSQQRQPNVGCIDKAIKIQAQDLHLSFAKQGMTIYRDAMISMNDREPFPVAVQLEKGHLYQLILIGSKGAGKIKMEIFDGKDKKIGDKTASLDKTDQNSNCIIYSFVPSTTDLYLIVLSQKAKGKELCGSFSIMEKEADKKATN